VSFNNLQLIEPLLQALNKEGLYHPNTFQQQAIPAILQKRDLLGVLKQVLVKPLLLQFLFLQLMHEQRQQLQQRQHRIQTLILTPTRELAIQIGESIAAYGRFLPFKYK
jgi:ATP-dependent RNA helicase RhlE